MNVDKLVPEGIEGPRAVQGQRGVRHRPARSAACAPAWATPAARHRRDAHAGAEFVEITSAGMRESTCTTCRSPRKRRTTGSSRQRRPEPRLLHDKILILDFGAQYTQLIARRVREAKVYCEIHPCDVGDAFVRDFGAEGHHPLGQPRSRPTRSRTLRAPQAVFELGVPVLGICYGMQTMAQQLGGKVEPGTVREFGYAEVRARGHTKLLDGIEDYRTRRRPRHARGVDEPRRQGRRAAAGLQADGLHRRLPDRRHGRRGAPLLRRAVPPRGHAHPAGHEAAAPLRARDLRLPRRLEHARLHRRSGRARSASRSATKK